VRQDEAETTTQTLTAGNDAKTTARGHGQHQCFVSTYTLSDCLHHELKEEKNPVKP